MLLDLKNNRVVPRISIHIWNRTSCWILNDIPFIELFGVVDLTHYWRFLFVVYKRLKFYGFKGVDKALEISLKQIKFQ